MRERLEECSHEGRPRRGGKHRGRYAEAILRTDGLELAGATDVDPGRAAELVRDLGGVAYASLADLLGTRRSTRSST